MFKSSLLKANVNMFVLSVAERSPVLLIVQPL